MVNIDIDWFANLSNDKQWEYWESLTSAERTEWLAVLPYVGFESNFVQMLWIRHVELDGGPNPYAIHNVIGTEHGTVLKKTVTRPDGTLESVTEYNPDGSIKSHTDYDVNGNPINNNTQNNNQQNNNTTSNQNQNQSNNSNTQNNVPNQQDPNNQTTSKDGFFTSKNMKYVLGGVAVLCVVGVVWWALGRKPKA